MMRVCGGAGECGDGARVDGACGVAVEGVETEAVVRVVSERVTASSPRLLMPAEA